MVIQRSIICIALMSVIGFSSKLHGQEKKLDKLRVGGGSASQMSLWLAKEGGSEKTPDPFSPPFEIFRDLGQRPVTTPP